MPKYVISVERTVVTFETHVVEADYPDAAVEKMRHFDNYEPDYRPHFENVESEDLTVLGYQEAIGS